jgi:hypothetical protein
MILKFWRVGCGDAISIHYKANDGSAQAIFIDGGYLSTYRDTIKKEILQLQSQGKAALLWIVTHTDRDHIGGVEAFIKDPTITGKENLVREFWFNCSSYSISLPSSKISIAQGIRLRDFLSETGKLRPGEIIASIPPANYNGCTLTVLSPDRAHLERSKQEWSDVERTSKIAVSVSDYLNSIENLAKEVFSEDTDPFNGGSIAVLLQYKEKNILLLADSFPSVIMDSLRKMGYGKDNKLKVDYLKLSHHGSRRNFDPELLHYIDCANFVILGNGISHNLPNKWTLAQIITHPERAGERIFFYFNYNTPQLQSLFSEEEKLRYNFECIFSEEPFLKIEVEE